MGDTRESRGFFFLLKRCYYYIIKSKTSFVNRFLSKSLNGDNDEAFLACARSTFAVGRVRMYYDDYYTTMVAYNILSLDGF